MSFHNKWNHITSFTKPIRCKIMPFYILFVKNKKLSEFVVEAQSHMGSNSESNFLSRAIITLTPNFDNQAPS